MKIKLWFRRNFLKSKWCVVSDYVHKHIKVEAPFKPHHCAWDYCHCSWWHCKACGREFYYPDGVDECR